MPSPLQQAILLLAAHWFEHREAAGAGVAFQELPMGVQALAAPYRVWLPEC